MRTSETEPAVDGRDPGQTHLPRPGQGQRNTDPRNRQVLTFEEIKKVTSNVLKKIRWKLLTFLIKEGNFLRF